MEGEFLRWLDSFTETNPDKGTETLYRILLIPELLHCLQKLTPIRGRKHLLMVVLRLVIRFTETNPDKGTETEVTKSPIIKKHIERLQKLTPIRGRKRY